MGSPTVYFLNPNKCQIEAFQCVYGVNFVYWLRYAEIGVYMC